MDKPLIAAVTLGCVRHFWVLLSAAAEKHLLQQQLSILLRLLYVVAEKSLTAAQALRLSVIFNIKHSVKEVVKKIESRRESRVEKE